MNGTKLSPEVDACIAKLVECFKPIVAMVEAAPQTSQYNYGDYLALIPQLVERLSPNSDGQARHNFYLIVAIALIEAGATKEGVIAAMANLGKL